MRVSASFDVAMTLRKVMTVLVITFSLLLLIAATLFFLDKNLDAISKLITITIAATGLTAAHFWATSIKVVTNQRYQAVMFGMLLFEFGLSIAMVILLTFKVGPTPKIIIMLITAQLVHLALYSMHWFFFEERNTDVHKSLSAEELSQLSALSASPLKPQYHTGSDHDN